MSDIFYHFTHRCVFSGFSAEAVKEKAKILEEKGIKTLTKSHNSNQMTGTIGQLPEYQVAYDLFVLNKDFDHAKALIS